MATPAKAPVKRAPRKKAVKPKKLAMPGEPAFDWRNVYPNDVELFRYTSDDGFVVSLPKFEEPGEGEIFGLMLLNKSEQDLLIYIMRQHITQNAIDPEGALQITFRALQKMRAPGMIESLLKDWPEASGVDLGKL